MRLKSETDGASHDGLDITVHDHHSKPATFDIDNVSQGINAGATFNLDIDLGRSDYQFARILIMGNKTGSGSGTQWRECSEIIASRDQNEAMGVTTRDVSFKKVYSFTYSKQNGDAYLTHKIFDSNVSQEYILLKDAYITGSTLRLVFENPTGTNAILWVKGTAHVF